VLWYLLGLGTGARLIPWLVDRGWFPFVTDRLVAHHAAQLRERAAAGVPTEEAWCS
jgi:hypothetical protein